MDSLEQTEAKHSINADRDNSVDRIIRHPEEKETTMNSPESTGSAEMSPLQKSSLLRSGKALLDDQVMGLRVIVGSGIAFALAITVALILSIYLGPPQIGKSGAVSCDVGECSRVGVDILGKGGSAVDAAIATMFCLGVINSQSSGIGGGGFMLIHDHKTMKSEVYDFRETAPAASTKLLLNDDLIRKRGLVVGVPGEVKGMEEAHKKYGKLTWSSLIQPAIDLARDGFNVTYSLAHSLETKLKPYDHTRDMKKRYERNGIHLKKNSIWSLPALANTLEIIASKGSSAIYDGELSDSIIDKVTSNGGIMTRDDLRNYKVKSRKSIQSEYHDYTLITTPLPSGGPVLIEILNILENFNFTTEDYGKATTYHKIIEAFKFSYGHKNLLGDPDFINVASKIADMMTNKEYCEKIRQKITNYTYSDPSVYGPNDKELSGKGTAHVSVIDSTELMVSVTTTVNWWFGSKLITSSGILLNNEMQDFAKSEQGTLTDTANLVEGNKRPLSSMSPSIVYKTNQPCSTRMVIGAANGTKIITGMAEVILNVLSFGKELKDAVNAPRVHNELIPNTTYYEADLSGAGKGISEDVAKELVSMGHTVQQFPFSVGLSVVNAILKKNDTIQAYADRRKGGEAATLSD